MSENEAFRVVAAKSVRSVETIDGGHTAAVRMTTAGGDELCVLLPTGAIAEMLFLIAEAYGAGHGGACRLAPGRPLVPNAPVGAMRSAGGAAIRKAACGRRAPSSAVGLRRNFGSVLVDEALRGGRPKGRLRTAGLPSPRPTQ